MSFGERLRQVREEAGITQAQLAEKLGLRSQTVSQWEGGKRLPSLETAQKVAEMFGVSIDYFMGKDNVRPGQLAELRAFLRASRTLTRVELRSLLAFAQYVRDARPEHKKVPDDPIDRED